MRSLVLSGLAPRAKPEGCDLTVHSRYAQTGFVMNHPNDRESESNRGESSKQLKLLEALIDKAIKNWTTKKRKTKSSKSSLSSESGTRQSALKIFELVGWAPLPSRTFRRGGWLTPLL